MSSQINWQDDLAAAQAAAQKDGKPVLLELFMHGCGHCARLHNETHADERVVKAVNAGFVPIKLDGMANMDIVKKHDVKGAPTTIILSADGQEKGRFAGFFSPEDYLKQLASLS